MEGLTREASVGLPHLRHYVISSEGGGVKRGMLSRAFRHSAGYLQTGLYTSRERHRHDGKN